VPSWSDGNNNGFATVALHHVAKPDNPHVAGLATMKLETLRKRVLLERTLRECFHSWGYEEVRTPQLVQSPGMEPHILPLSLQRPADSTPVFLPTSPEFGMKKLLALGFERIFQLCPAFRDEPRSPEHHPEFTMLEFYEANLSLEGLQNRVESLFRTLCKKLHGAPSFPRHGKLVRLDGSWKSFRVPDLFESVLGIDLRSHDTSEKLHAVCNSSGISSTPDEPWDDLYFKLWLNRIEPALPANEAFFVTHYPLSQSSLCNHVLDEKGFAWGNRFEVYMGRTELGNAFDELRDPVQQRENFHKDQRTRKAAYGDLYPESPIDEELLAAIERMPPTAGIAIGWDRLVMLLLDAKDIEEVLFLKSWW
jgi:lysyl-tRNA synthetase class 2